MVAQCSGSFSPAIRRTFSWRFDIVSRAVFMNEVSASVSSFAADCAFPDDGADGGDPSRILSSRMLRLTLISLSGCSKLSEVMSVDASL